MPYRDAPLADRSIVILIVEDDLILRDLLAEVMTEMGAKVHTAPTADEGWDAVMEHPELNLLITDVVTPGTATGWDLAARVHEQKPDLPVIVTSGFSAKHAADLPPNATFLAKPWSLSEICTLVNSSLERR